MTIKKKITNETPVRKHKETEHCELGTDIWVMELPSVSRDKNTLRKNSKSSPDMIKAVTLVQFSSVQSLSRVRLLATP